MPRHHGDRARGVRSPAGDGGERPANRRQLAPWSPPSATPTCAVCAGRVAGSRRSRRRARARCSGSPALERQARCRLYWPEALGPSRCLVCRWPRSALGSLPPYSPSGCPRHCSLADFVAALTVAPRAGCAPVRLPLSGRRWCAGSALVFTWAPARWSPWCGGTCHDPRALRDSWLVVRSPGGPPLPLRADGPGRRPAPGGGLRRLPPP